jgi:hypothetical protein
MNWLASNWVWLLLIFGMFAMHFFSHGRHSHGHAGHHHGGRDDLDRSRDPTDGARPEERWAPTEQEHGSSTGLAQGRDSAVPSVGSDQAGVTASSLEHAGHDGARPAEKARHSHRGCC